LTLSMLLVGADKYRSTRRLSKTLKTFINSSKSAKVTDFMEMGVFTEDGHFHGKCHGREMVNYSRLVPRSRRLCTIQFQFLAVKKPDKECG